MKRSYRVMVLITMLATASLMGFPCAAAEQSVGEVQIINQLVTIDPYEVIQPATVNSKPGTTVVLDQRITISGGNTFSGQEGCFSLRLTGKFFSR